MADPISIAASIAGLITTGVQVSHGIAKIVWDTRSAPSTIQSLNQQLVNLCKIFSSINTRIEKVPLRPLPGIPIDDLSELLENIKGDFKDLQTVVDEYAVRSADSGISQRWKQFLWVFQESEVKDLMRRIDIYKAAMSLTVTVATSSEVTEISKELREVRLLCQGIKDRDASLALSLRRITVQGSTSVARVVANNNKSKISAGTSLMSRLATNSSPTSTHAITSLRRTSIFIDNYCDGIETIGSIPADDPADIRAGPVSQIPQEATIKPKLDINGIKVLSSEESNAAAKVDIIAIHGLGGHAEETWTDPVTGAFWLRDFLTEDAKAARIMTFGYDTKVSGKSISGFRKCAETLLRQLRAHRTWTKNRPIVFICHSLGGIICKQALVLAQGMGVSYEDIPSSAYGILFMGTPHQDSGAANMGGMLDSLETLVSVWGSGKSLRDRLAKDLQANSKALSDTSKSFIERAGHLRIVSFYEQSCMHGVAKLVVEKELAVLGIPSETAVPMDADHGSICRFGSSKDNNYLTVLFELKVLCGEVVDSREMESEDDSQSDFLDALKGEAMGPTEDYLEGSPDHYPGTCEWILQNSNYQGWDESPSSSGLWVSGDLGTGKTVLSKFLIQTLKENEKSGYRPVYASFFCHRENTTDLSLLLRSFLHQILTQDPSLFKFINSEAKDLINDSRKMWDILKDMMLSMKETLVLIVDGVDVFTEEMRSQLLTELRVLMEVAISECLRFGERGPRLKIIVTSRPYEKDTQDPSQIIPEMRRLLLHENHRYINADIRKVISNNINTFTGENGFRISSKHAVEIEDAFIGGANGIFLWAILAWFTFIRPEDINSPGQQLKRTESLRNRNELNVAVMRKKLKLLKKFPNSITGLYNRALRDTPERYVDDSKTIFRCLLAAAQPLTVAELTIILNLKSQSQKEWCNSSKEVVANARGCNWEERIKLACGPFVSIGGGKVVRLHHHTVRDFFTMQPPKNNDNPQSPEFTSEWKFRLDEVHQYLGKFCLTYLSFEEFAIGPLKSKFDDELEAESLPECKRGFRTLTADFSFLEYAAVHWSHHAQRASKSKELLQSSDIFQVSSRSINLAFQIFWFRKGCKGPFPSKMTPLHIICYYGLDILIPELALVRKEDLYTTDIYGRIPLHWAAANGHLTTVRDLLELDENLILSLPETNAPTPLYLAAGHGHTALVQLLLEKGAPINTTNKEVGSPLQASAHSGHLDVLELLLREGAAVDSQAGEFGTALQAAAYAGHLELVKLLVEIGANVNANAEESTFQNALQATLGKPMAARISGKHDYEYQILKLLLDKGAEVNACGGFYGDALQAAAAHGKLGAVKLLLKSGSSLTNRGGNWGSAIQAAASGGHLPVLKRLLNPTNGLNFQKDVLKSAMEMAAENGYDLAAKLLGNALESGVDMKVSGSYQKPFQFTGKRTSTTLVAVRIWPIKTQLSGDEGGRLIAEAIVKSFARSLKSDIKRRARFGIRHGLKVGAEAFQIALGIPDNRMVRVLFEAALSILLFAIEKYNETEGDKEKAEAKSIVVEIMRTWVATLESEVIGGHRSVIKVLIDSMVSQLTEVLDQADEIYAKAEKSPEFIQEAAEKVKVSGTISEALVGLLRAAVWMERHEMVEFLVDVVSKALGRVLQGSDEKCRPLVEEFVAAWGDEFEDALDKGQRYEAEALLRTGSAILLAAVNLGNQNLVKVISTVSAKVLNSILEKGHYDIVLGLISAKKTVFKSAVDYESETKVNSQIEDQKTEEEVRVLLEAGLAVLFMAVERKYRVLVDLMSGIWTRELNSASEYGNMESIIHLVTSWTETMILDTDALPEEAAQSETVTLAEVVFAFLLASIEIGHTALIETISSTWVVEFNSAIDGKDSKVMRGFVESRTTAFKTVVDAGLKDKAESLSNAVVVLWEAAEEARMTQLTGILTEVWVSTLQSATDGSRANLIGSLVSNRAMALNTAITKGLGAKADMILAAGLELLLGTITHTKGSSLIVETICNILTTALQAAVDQGYNITEKLEAFKKSAAITGNQRDAGISTVGLFLLLAATEESMQQVMNIVSEVWGVSLDAVDGEYSRLVKKFVWSKAKKFSSMHRRRGRDANGMIYAVMSGDYGVVAQRLITEAVRNGRVDVSLWEIYGEM